MQDDDNPDATIVPSMQAHFHIRIVDPTTVKANSIITTNIDSLCFEVDTPTDQALEMISHMAEVYPDIPIIFITRKHSESLAIWAIRHHIFEFFYKPLDTVHIAHIQQSLKSLNTQTHTGANETDTSLIQSPTKSRYKHSKDKPVLDCAIAFVENHVAEKISDSTVAERCHITSFQLRRVFHRQFDMTFQEYVSRYRMEMAKKLLQNSRGSISNVAYQVGFSDPSYFTRVFKQLCKLSPKQFQSQFYD